MAAIRFGTDGVRGKAFDELTRRDAYSIGRAAADVLGGTEAVIGRDTRESGSEFSAAVAAGLLDGGLESLDLGVAPTPAVAVVARSRAAIGVVISASHNPWYDNGIKIFSRQGSKLSDSEQLAVESRLAAFADSANADYIAASDNALTARPASIQPEIATWINAIRASIDGDVAGLRVVLDCANGAASHVVAPALIDLGADVTVLFNEPDGRNINDGCGSTYPEALAAEVVSRGADIGLALDGDADRLLAVDATGEVVDGDHLMAMVAIDMNERGVLAGSQLVVTVMSNLGLLQAMQRHNINVEVTPVGDRNVLIALDRLGATFGGEQSGHLIFSDLTGTGDGFLSAVQVLWLMKRTGSSLRALAQASMTSLPQVLKNVAVSQRLPDVATLVSADIALIEARLGDSGRVLVRPSGTEPVVRVMVEAADPDEAERACDELCTAVAAL